MRCTAHALLRTTQLLMLDVVHITFGAILIGSLIPVAFSFALVFWVTGKKSELRTDR
jgi:hypothetical protein